MTIEEITQDMQITDTATGRTFTITRMPTSRKKSIGIVEVGGSGKELMMWKNELPRFVKA